MSTTVATPNASGSIAPMPTSRLSSSRLTPAASARPTTVPTSAEPGRLPRARATHRFARCAERHAQRRSRACAGRRRTPSARRGRAPPAAGRSCRRCPRSRRPAAAAAGQARSLPSAFACGSPAGSDRRRATALRSSAMLRAVRRSTNVERDFRHELLRQWHVDEVARRLADLTVLARCARRRRSSSVRVPRCARPRAAAALPDRIAVPATAVPPSLSLTIATYGAPSRSRVGERSALHDRHPQRREVARRDRRPNQLRPRRVRRDRCSPARGGRRARARRS